MTSTDETPVAGPAARQRRGVLFGLISVLTRR